MKFGLFGLSNKKLVQVKEDDAYFIRNKRIDSYSEDSKIFTVFFIFYIIYKITIEHVIVKIASINNHTSGETLRGLSSRFVWFDLVRSLATFDTPVLYIAKLGGLVINGNPRYDPETDRHDAVSYE